MTYAEQLQHPSWQRKRLEILKASQFRCAGCGSAEDTLTAHHSYYQKGLMLWQYPDEAYHCLCMGCHEERRDAEAALLRAVYRLSVVQLKKLTRSLSKKLNPDCIMEMKP